MSSLTPDNMLDALDSRPTAAAEDFIKTKVLPVCLRSLEAFCRVFYNETFTEPFEQGHKDYMAALDATLGVRQSKLLQIAFRGYGKSTILEAHMARGILYKLVRFIVYTTATAENAEFQTESLRRQLLGNARIRRAFPSIKVDAVGDLPEDDFGKKHWAANGYTFVLPRGPKQKVRGLRSPLDGKRPDMLVADDFEDAALIRSKQIRIRNQSWILSDFFMSVPQHMTAKYSIIYSDTIKHSDAMPEILKKDPSFTCMNFPLCDAEFKTLYPRLFPQEQVDKLIASYRGMGLMYLFWREKMNKIVHGDEQTFRMEYFQYCPEGSEELAKPLGLRSAIIVDPAKTTNLASADSAIIGVSFSPSTRRIYFRDCVSAKLHPEQIYKTAFDMAERLGTRTIAYEVTGLNEFITHPFMNAAFESGKQYEFIELKPRRQKEEVLLDLDLSEKAMRVAALLPYYRKGQIFHNPTCCHKLEAQLLDFPEPELWDVADAFSYVIELMMKTLRFFNAAQVSTPVSLDEMDVFQQLRKNYMPPLRRQQWQ